MWPWERQLDRTKKAADFTLPDVSGKMVSLDDFDDNPALLVAFICNHCPFVLHLIDHFAEFAREYEAKGLQVVAISSNDPEEFPEDDFEHMKAFSADHRLSFPYLYDETQNVARDYQAVCTPDFFLFDGERNLFYAGQYDSSRPEIDKPLPPELLPDKDYELTGEDLRAAVDALLSGRDLPFAEKPSMGCSIKWRPGNDT